MVLTREISHYHYKILFKVVKNSSLAFQQIQTFENNTFQNWISHSLRKTIQRVYFWKYASRRKWNRKQIETEQRYNNNKVNRRAEFVGEDFLNKCFCSTQFRLTDTRKIKNSFYFHSWFRFCKIIVSLVFFSLLWLFDFMTINGITFD